MKKYASASTNALATSQALQELRNVRNHLYIAAEHYESAYLHSDQKLLIFESLKDYSTKAFVNALDHIGTGASQLNESLTQHAAEFSNLQVCLSSVAQRLSTCHECTTYEGLNKWRHKKQKMRYNKHYDAALDLTIMDETPVPLLELLTEKRGNTSHEAEQSDSNVFQTLSWHLSTELSPINPRNVQRNRNRSSSPAHRHKKMPIQRRYYRSLSSGEIFIHSHEFDASWRAHIKDASMCRSNSLLSLMMSEKMEQEITPDKVALPSSLETTVGRIKIDNKLLYSFHG